MEPITRDDLILINDLSSKHIQDLVFQSLLVYMLGFILEEPQRGH